MNFALLTTVACIALSAGMLLIYLAGYRYGRHRLREFDEAAEGTGAITGAVFALLGLLIAFTFSGSFNRFELRRQILVQETNAIGTAYLRLDLLPADAQPPLRTAFRAYTESRAALYGLLGDPPAARREIARAQGLQQQIWGGVVAASSGPDYNAARMLLLPAVNEMIDITTTRSIAILTHTPPLIYATLFALALACAGLAGYGSSASDKLSYVHMLGFVVATTFTLYVTLNIEFPRHGLVSLDRVNQALVELAESMR